MPNDINSISPDIRDFLLNRNLILSDTVNLNGLSGAATGLGLPSTLETLPEAVQASENIETSSISQRDSLITKNPYSSTDDITLTNIITEPLIGILNPGAPSVEYGSYVGSTTENSIFNTKNDEIRKRVALKNQYISEEQMVNATIIDNSFSYNQVDGGYLIDGQLNLGGSATAPYDTIGALVTGNGFGLDNTGLDPQFSIRNSLAGRVLSATGAINDTQLGTIGGQQLLFALAQKGVFGAQRELHQSFNVNVPGLLKGDALFKHDYSISVRSTTGGRVLDRVLDVTGVELPTSVIEPGASIFQDESGFNTDYVLRNNALIKNTGKGQYSRLFDALNANTSDLSKKPQFIDINQHMKMQI